jgi:hypothetical protein
VVSNRQAFENSKFPPILQKIFKEHGPFNSKKRFEWLNRSQCNLGNLVDFSTHAAKNLKIGGNVEFLKACRSIPYISKYYWFAYSSINVLACLCMYVSAKVYVSMYQNQS